MADSPNVEQTNPVSSFSFDAAHQKAMEMLEAPPAAPAAVEPQGTPQAPPVEQPAAPQPTVLADDAIVTVTVDGQEVQIPWKDAKAGIMRQSKFTQGMQQLAATRQEIEAHQAETQRVQQEREALITLLNDEGMLRQLLAAKYPHMLGAQPQVPQAPEADPAEIADIGQVRTIVGAEVQKALDAVQALQSKAQESVSKAVKDMEDAREVEGFNKLIKSTVSALFEKHPILTVIPNAEDLIRYEVAKLNPGDEKELQDALSQVASGLAEDIDKKHRDINKAVVVEKQKLLDNNIQPPGGSPPTVTPESFNKVGKTGKTEVDWDKVRAASLGILGG